MMLLLTACSTDWNVTVSKIERTLGALLSEQIAPKMEAVNVLFVPHSLNVNKNKVQRDHRNLDTSNPA